MKLFTRFATPIAALLLSAASAFAANITILVGDNYYRGPGNTTLDRDVRTITLGDQVTWSYVGQSSHPTMSDSSPALWATFPMNSASTTFRYTFNTVGTFPYHCTAHGNAAGLGQSGLITVVAANPTATLDSREAGISLDVYPNPSRGQVTVKLTQKAGQTYQLRLSNIIGQEIRTIALKPELTAAGLPLDLSDLRTGVYFYSLLVDGKVASTKRLVLQN